MKEQINFLAEFYNSYSNFLDVVVWFKNADGNNSWKNMTITAPEDYSAQGIVSKVLSYLPDFAKNNTFLIEVTTPTTGFMNLEGGYKVLKAVRTF